MNTFEELTVSDLPRLHFSRAEYAGRMDRLKAGLVEQGVDAAVIFKSDDMYWLTGLDTDGYYVFHAMIITADGKIVYLGRQADFNNARYSSILEDVRVFDELAQSNRAVALKAVLAELGLAGKKVGIQYNTMGHRADLYMEITAEFGAWCTFSDVSHLFERLKLVKTDAEIDVMRKGSAITHKMVDAAKSVVRAGVFEGKVFAKLAECIYENDGDPCALRYPIGCGEASKLGRYTSGRHYVAETDQFMFEIGCGYRNYHTAIYFHVHVGAVPHERLRDLLKICQEAREAGQAQMRPGNVIGQIHEAVSNVYLRNGLENNLRKSYGYSMGICYPPTWVAAPMIISGSKEVIEENMTLFLHPSLMDTDTGFRVSSGETARITSNGIEKLTIAPKDLILN